MVALSAALTIIIVGVGLLAYLADVLVDEQRRTNAHLEALRQQAEPTPPTGTLYREWLDAETRRRRGEP